MFLQLTVNNWIGSKRQKNNFLFFYLTNQVHSNFYLETTDKKVAYLYNYNVKKQREKNW